MLNNPIKHNLNVYRLSFAFDRYSATRVFVRSFNNHMYTRRVKYTLDWLLTTISVEHKPRFKIMNKNPKFNFHFFLSRLIIKDFQKNFSLIL